VHLTFDDGNRSDVTDAMPMLLRLGRRASFFLLSAFIGRPDFVTRDDVAQLHAAGMAIGSHGADHVRWTTLGNAELVEQISRSIQTLATLTREPINSVAVPFGAYDRRVLDVLRQLNIATVFTSDGGPARPGAWIKGRTTVRMDTPLEAIEALLSDRLSVQQRLQFLARSWKRRLRSGF
jgi:peptidoglycan/xylan/chitin deacetylase (PgdA/CDA1 family)